MASCVKIWQAFPSPVEAQDATAGRLGVHVLLFAALRVRCSFVVPAMVSGLDAEANFACMVF